MKDMGISWKKRAFETGRRWTVVFKKEIGEM
jgi:hypothetical protein